MRREFLKSNSLTPIQNKSFSPPPSYVCKNPTKASIGDFYMAKGFGYDYEDFDPQFEHVVEIYNAWGCSECTEKEGNLRPISSESKNGVFPFESGSIRNALNRN